MGLGRSFYKKTVNILVYVAMFPSPCATCRNCRHFCFRNVSNCRNLTAILALRDLAQFLSEKFSIFSVLVQLYCTVLYTMEFRDKVDQFASEVSQNINFVGVFASLKARRRLDLACWAWGLCRPTVL